jgi:hypothetical protein
MTTRADGRKTKDWVDSSFFEQPYERTQRLDPQEFNAGITVRELDFEVDTIPAELIDLFK